MPASQFRALDSRLGRWKWALLFAIISAFAASATIPDLWELRLDFVPFYAIFSGIIWGFGAGLATLLLLLALPFDPVPTSLVRELGLIGLYITTWLLRRRGWSLVEGTAVYGTSCIIIWTIIEHFKFGIDPNGISLLAYTRIFIVYVVGAAVLDALVTSFYIRRSFPFVVGNQQKTLLEITKSTLNLNISAFFVMALVWEANNLDNLARGAQLRVQTEILSALDPNTPLPTVKHYDRRDNTSLEVVIANSRTDITALSNRLFSSPCKRVTGIEADPQYSFGRLDLWMHDCHAYSAAINGRPVMVVENWSEMIGSEAGSTFLRLLAMFALAAAASVYATSLIRQISRSVDATIHAVNQFGSPVITLETQPFVSEMARITTALIETNTSFMTAVEQRQRLQDVFKDLQLAIGFHVMSNVTYDPDSGALSFLDVSLDGKSTPRTLIVHPTDQVLFQQIATTANSLIEFRQAAEGDESQLLSLRETTGRFQWASGLIITLRQPKRMRELVLHQARLVDLGGMASAIGHELKQPLFTISMAAQSAQLLLQTEHTSTIDAATERLARVVDQVGRAQIIIDRIVSYGRISLNADDDASVVDAIRSACMFLQPMLDKEAITVNHDHATEYTVNVPRVALEQVMVNALRNAIEAIVQARATGVNSAGGIVDFRTHRANGIVTVSVGDNGVGIDPVAVASAFEPFITTKATSGGSGLGLFVIKQIVMEAGGKVELRANPAGGAILTIDLPQSVPTPDRIN
jgi:signal transduction histidine kinase